MKRISPELVQYTTEMRHLLHQNAELSFHEHKTTEIILNELRKLPVEITTWEDICGAVALLRGGSPGPTVALRADIDALPLQEDSGSPYASKNPGAMHACAHDMHTAILLGVAKYYSEHREELRGNLKFIFQPAEEVPPGGAKTLIEKGVLQNPKVDAVFGLHHATENRTGEIGIHYGQFLASADSFTLTLHVKGGGGSAPHKGVDGIMVAAEIITAIEVAMTRRIDPVKVALISFGTIHAGTAFNILANTVEISGTARTLDPEAMRQIPQIIEETAGGIAAVYGGTVELNYKAGYPCVVNDMRMTKILETAAVKAIGSEKVFNADAIMAGDDMAYYLQEVPGSYFWLGITPPSGIIAPAHTPKFDIDEGAIETGLEVMAAVAAEALEELA